MKFYIFCLLGIVFYVNDVLAELTVCSSIRPLYSLVENITKDINNSKLLVSKPNSSPHNYSLSPSELKLLSSCDIIFLIDKNLEYFLPKAIATAGKKNLVIVELTKDASIHLLKTREKIINKNKDDTHHEHHHSEDDLDHHHHGENDLHIWLDPENAKAILKIVANTLMKYDTAHLDQYVLNAEIAQDKVTNLDKEVGLKLQPYKNSSYLVFHDAYQYFDTHYKLNYLGEFSSSGSTISAKKLSLLQDIIIKNKVKCIFSEPEFSNHIITKIAQNTKIKTGVLDAEWGGNNTQSNDIYFALMRNLADNFVQCMNDR
ncbi:High-affinity zinc uptake system protein znuA precursor [Rickettsiales bacterium Ac37b]|nr:High-affinity zinc uptake system protein znuA precursor [Rickettsiales bacterium Ac37b]